MRELGFIANQSIRAGLLLLPGKAVRRVFVVSLNVLPLNQPATNKDIVK